jgi:glucose-1-phosphate thymidylyltransferase
MKGIILAAGLGTRLQPLTSVTSKVLLPIYDRPMIYYPIKSLVDAGITDIICVIGGPYASHFISALKDGKALGIKNLHYVYQENLESGPGEALLCAEEFAGDGSVAVVLGDQVTDASLKEAIESFDSGATVFLQKYMDPEGMGVPEFDSQNPDKIVRIEENPKNPASEYAATGIYLYDNQCFSFIHKLQKEIKGEIKPTDINSMYIEKKQLSWAYLDGFWVDAGKFDRLYEATKYFAQKDGL